MTLKSCPFCLTDSTVELYPEWISENEQGFKISCGSCGCNTKFFWKSEDAVNFWNTRPSIPNNDNCPICNQSVKLLAYKVRLEQQDPFFQYLCQCGFNSGISKNKQLIIDNWIQRKKSN